VSLNPVATLDFGTELFIGMVRLKVESKYLQEHTSIKSRREIIQKHERW
jgi:hypothetical protein